MKKYYYQRGYGGTGMFLAAVAIGLVMYFFFYPTKFPSYSPTTSDQICYLNPPDTSQTIVDSGVKYNLLKPKAPITSVQFHIHAVDITGKQILNGKERTITKAFTDPDGNIGHGAWLVDGNDKSALDLRFVNVTDEVPNPLPGISYVDVYLKDGSPIPPFIENFCGRKPKISDIAIFPDDSENTFPPYSIDVTTIKDWHCEPKINDGVTGADCNKKLADVPKTGKYYLYAYDTPGSYLTAFIERTGIMPYGTIDLAFNGKTDIYKTVYAGGWESKHIGLYGTNPQDPTQQVVYRYIKEDLLKVEQEKNPYFRVVANPSKAERPNLQLGFFTPSKISHTAWWTPECKPAVYLYPKETMAVNVKVTINNGFLTYTDPLYPNTNGWNVIAQPDGSLRYINNNFSDSKGLVNYPTGMFPYLYYEGKVADSAVQKPEEGYVIAYDQLATFYDDLLPKLGLNQKESKEFKEYWLKALPNASYYFIGIIPQEQLNENEPLTITPKEDTMIRVRLYFEARDEWQSVKAPELQRPARSGFTVVDWGGMVKRDKDHPFTCVQ